MRRSFLTRTRKCRCSVPNQRVRGLGKPSTNTVVTLFGWATVETARAVVSTAGAETHRYNEVEGAAMQITLDLPEDIVQELRSKWKELPRAALESLALEAYRSHALTAAQLRRLLGFETRMQVDGFLKEHEVYDFTAADFEQDRETLRQLRAKEAQH